MKPLRIVFSEAATSYGGQEQYIHKLMKGLRDQGHHLEAICQPHAILAQKLAEDGFTVHTLLTDGPKNFVQGVWRLRKVLRQGRFDVVNTNSRRDTLLAGTAARLAGVPLIVRSRHLAKKVGSLLSYTIVPHAVIACSEYVRSHLLDRGVKPSQVRVVYPSVPTDEWPQGSTLRDELKLAANDVVITCVAVMRAQKGHKTLLQAVEPLIKAQPNIHLVLAGSGAMLDELQQFVAMQGLEKRVHFLGMRSDIPNVLNGSDIFALATEIEATGTVYVEAEAAGLPVVGTRVGGVPEMMVEFETGLLVPPNDPVAMREALSRLIDNEVLRKTMGSAGRRFVMQGDKFSLDAMVSTTEQAYRYWLDQRTGGLRS